MTTVDDGDRPFEAWMAALEARHLAALRFPEVTRALRAVSSAYVQRRHAMASGAPLDSAGKRAAFAVFYGPLHYLAVSEVLRALDAGPSPAFILDLGCGTGAAGAAWAVAGRRSSARVQGIDRHPWAVAEARWTYRQFGIAGRARTGDLARLPPLDGASGVLAAYVLNELSDAARERLLRTMLHASEAGTAVLVLEPIARSVAPWWDDAAGLFVASGGRADEWRFRVALPPLVQRLDAAAGLNHGEITVRTLAIRVGRR